ncbi:MAG: hypothetical protein AAGD11_16530 [Planctomycetota bacterium]
MAKRKRASHEKPFARSSKKQDSSPAEVTVAEDQAAADGGVAAPFIGKWNRLISTTNWEKGQIVCEWRDALMTAGAAVTEYSDEAWAQTVGGVTSQHVGRLRRVFQRFGDVANQYEGLHWSHFQACLDWDDAEMWLEGSIQNGWSVSQMRGRRWETVGASPEQQQAEVEQLAVEQQSEADAEEEQAQAAADQQDAPFESNGPTTAEIEPFGGSVQAEEEASTDTATATEPIERRARLSVDVESLPDDLAEAFESFKLAIIAHRRENWRNTTPQSIVECLDSLKQLALAESD